MFEYFPTLTSFFDFLALVIVLGVLSCRLWVLPPGSLLEFHTVWVRMRRLMGQALAVLTATSFLGLLNRAADMSGETPLAAFPLLPIVLLQTHYGLIWLVRAGAVLALWIGWGAMARFHGTPLAGFMFGMAAIIAWTYSASGHAADFGDFTWTQGIDWLHVMSGAIWGGGLLNIAIAIRPAFLGHCDNHRAFIAEFCFRASRLATLAFVTVLASGIYNSTVHLTALNSLLTTAYGWILLVKIGLVVLMVRLGAINRYSELPNLAQWSPNSLAASRLPQPPPLVGWLLPGPHRGDDPAPCFLRRVAWEAAVMVIVAICVALLLHSAPPHHQTSGMEDQHEHHAP